MKKVGLLSDLKCRMKLGCLKITPDELQPCVVAGLRSTTVDLKNYRLKFITNVK